MWAAAGWQDPSRTPRDLFQRSLSYGQVEVLKQRNIELHCKACGLVSNVDAHHKLNTFILKNPPEDKMSKAEET